MTNHEAELWLKHAERLMFEVYQHYENSDGSIGDDIESDLDDALMFLSDAVERVEHLAHMDNLQSEIDDQEVPC